MAENVASRVRLLVRDAEDYRDELSEDRVTAMAFYDGDADAVPYEQDRSKLVSKDVRAAIKKVRPSIFRTLLGNDAMVEFEPVSQGDEESAQQASDFINYVILPESNGKRAIEDALTDAMKLRNGILYSYIDKRRDVRVSMHEGLDDEAFSILVSDDDVTVLEHTESQEQVDGQPFTTHAVKIKRTIEKREIRVKCLPPEKFLIHSDAEDIDTAILVGFKERYRRGDLVAMGYDIDAVKALPATGEDSSEEFERTERRDIASRTTEAEVDWTLEEVDYWELYVRLDQDGDGIPELSRMCFAGAVTEKGMLENDPCDEAPFASVEIEREPHQWEGVSLTDDLIEIQKAKTVFLRNTADNIYWQNNLQPVVQEGVIINPEAVSNPKFGQPIRVSRGVSAAEAVQYNMVPFVGQHSFAMLQYLDNEATERTGVSDASSGLAPGALQNMTAKASAMIEQSGIGQVEVMVMTAAEGLKVFFRKLLRLVIRYQDKPRTIRLNGQWVQFDPRHWNAEMDATVNVGLGAGTRERDMMVMQQVIMLQEKMLAGFGPDNPFVKPENVYTAVSKMVEAAGLKTPSMYFTEPNPEEIAAKLAEGQNKPDPAMQKVQAQAQADAMKLELDRQRLDAEMQLKREQIGAEIELKREQMAMEMQMRAAFSGMSSGGVDIRLGGQPG